MTEQFKIKILIADDHELYREGLKGFFTRHEVYQVIGEAADGEELIRKALQLHPHIILTDLKMPYTSGAAAIREILKVHPDIKCVILTSYENDHSIVEAMESGAAGYITKNMPKEELFYALEDVSMGINYYCRSTNGKMIRLLAASQFTPFLKDKKVSFNPTEKKIIQLICEEKNNEEIAVIMSLSSRTIENNRSRILKKINAKTTAGVAIYAIKHGLYSLE